MAQLGLLVVALSAVLALVFYVIKNRLDALEPKRVFVAAVLGYTVSWLLRGAVDGFGGTVWDYPAIVLIAFLTALFRLVFNKRFFDIARSNDPDYYIVAKSHWSQVAMAVLYLGFAWSVFGGMGGAASLPLFYAALIPLSLIYLRYRWNGNADSHESAHS